MWWDNNGMKMCTCPSLVRGRSAELRSIGAKWHGLPIRNRWKVTKAKHRRKAPSGVSLRLFPFFVGDLSKLFLTPLFFVLSIIPYMSSSPSPIICLHHSLPPSSAQTPKSLLLQDGFQHMWNQTSWVSLTKNSRLDSFPVWHFQDNTLYPSLVKEQNSWPWQVTTPTLKLSLLCLYDKTKSYKNTWNDMWD